jgi:hypothetical protein
MTDYQVAEYMELSLDGTSHAALLARPGSGVVFDSRRKRWVPETRQGDSEMYIALRNSVNITADFAKPFRCHLSSHVPRTR